MPRKTTPLLIGLVWIAPHAGCNTDALLNQTATFGPSGGTAAAGAPLGSGLRGTFRVVIENNTPWLVSECSLDTQSSRIEVGQNFRTLLQPVFQFIPKHCFTKALFD